VGFLLPLSRFAPYHFLAHDYAAGSRPRWGRIHFQAPLIEFVNPQATANRRALSLAGSRAEVKGKSPGPFGSFWTKEPFYGSLALDVVSHGSRSADELRLLLFCLAGAPLVWPPLLQ
jgi:hypothetical protein